MVCHYLNLDSDASKAFYKVEEYNNIYPFVYAPVLEAHSIAMYEVILKIEQLDKFLLDLSNSIKKSIPNLIWICPALETAKCFKWRLGNQNKKEAPVIINYRSEYNEKYMKNADIKEYEPDIKENNKMYSKCTCDIATNCDQHPEVELIRDYCQKQRDAIYDALKEERYKIMTSGQIGCKIRELCDVINLAGIRVSISELFDIFPRDLIITEAQKRSLCDTEQHFYELEQKLKHSCEECEQLCKMCDTYEQKLQLLINYDIISSEATKHLKTKKTK
jgi:hypothetical protein